MLEGTDVRVHHVYHTPEMDRGTATACERIRSFGFAS
jgi:hypothetical protein